MNALKVKCDNMKTSRILNTKTDIMLHSMPWHCSCAHPSKATPTFNACAGYHQWYILLSIEKLSAAYRRNIMQNIIAIVCTPYQFMTN